MISNYWKLADELKKVPHLSEVLSTTEKKEREIKAIIDKIFGDADIVREWAMVGTDPLVASWGVDFMLASMALHAYLDGNMPVSNYAMGVRERFTNVRALRGMGR